MCTLAGNAKNYRKRVLFEQIWRSDTVVVALSELLEQRGSVLGKGAEDVIDPINYAWRMSYTPVWSAFNMQ